MTHLQIQKSEVVLEQIKQSDSITAKDLDFLRSLSASVGKDDDAIVERTINQFNTYILSTSNEHHSNGVFLAQLSKLDREITTLSSTTQQAIVSQLTNSGTAMSKLTNYTTLLNHLNTLGRRTNSMISALNENCPRSEWPEPLQEQFKSLVKGCVAPLEERASMTDVIGGLDKIAAAFRFAEAYSRFAAVNIHDHSTKIFKNGDFVPTVRKVLKQMDENASFFLKNKQADGNSPVVVTHQGLIADRANNLQRRFAQNGNSTIMSLLFLDPEHYSYKASSDSKLFGTQYKSGKAAKDQLVTLLNECACDMTHELESSGKVAKTAREKAWIRPREMVNIVSDFLGADGRAKFNTHFTTGGFEPNLMRKIEYRMASTGSTGRMEMGITMALLSGSVPWILSLENQKGSVLDDSASSQ